MCSRHLLENSYDRFAARIRNRVQKLRYATRER